MFLLSDEHEFCVSLIRQTFIAESTPKNQFCFSNKAVSLTIRFSYEFISVLVCHAKFQGLNPIKGKTFLGKDLFAFTAVAEGQG